MTLTGALALFLLSWRWFTHPVQDSPTHADAIVVFAGGTGDRFRKAVQLAKDGIAPTIIVNIGAQAWVGKAEILEHCSQKDLPYELICLLVEEDNTAGEARQFALKSQAMGMNHLVAVTSEFHLKRAGVLLRQCHNGKISLVGSVGKAGRTPLLSEARARELIHEWGGLLFAWTVERFRNCP